LENPRRIWKDNIKLDLENSNGKELTGFIWLTLRVSDMLLQIQLWISGSEKCDEFLDYLKPFSLRESG
jgi:hypothetical protein